MNRVLIAFLLSLVPSALRAQQPAPPKDKPVTQEEIARLRRDIETETRSSLELLLGGHAESGDLNNELGYLRAGLRLNLRRGDSTTLHLATTYTPYRTQDGVVEVKGAGLAVGVASRVSPRADYQWELGATRFADEGWSFTGQASVAVKSSDQLRYSVAASRTNVEESILAVAGLTPVVGPFAGRRVGAVRDNRLQVGAAWQLPAQFDLAGEAAIGVRSGSNVGTNAFRRAGGGAGWNARAAAPEERLSLLRLSGWVEYFGFDENRLGYGGASLADEAGRPIPVGALGSDDISPEPSGDHAGVGGYFSPHRFVSAVGRLEARGRARPSLDYHLSGYLGTQSFTGSQRRRAGGLLAAFTVKASERISVPLTYRWDDYGPFTEQSFSVRLLFLL